MSKFLDLFRSEINSLFKPKSAIVISTPSSTTFKVSNLKLKRFSLNETPTSTICSQLMPYHENHCTEVLMETQFPSTVRATENNGFINTVIDCYNNHYNLVIRPDDIWTAIMTQFSFYINANAEEFRSQFVNFQGKEEIEVRITESLRSAPYDLFVTRMTEKINEYLVDDTVKDWVLPNFTTTTPNDKVSCGVVLMAATKKYLSFKYRLLCGIPFITLEGSVDDWENILKRLEKLKSYKLDKWYDMLKPILMEFVAARKTQPNIRFWNRICLQSGISGIGCGPRIYISGWLTAFAVFDEKGEWMCEKMWPKINIADIPSGIVTVDVKIVDLDGVEYNSVMFAGHVAYEMLVDNFALKPRIGWGVALKLSDEEIEKLRAVA